ncbi:hypothetical protein [Yersinia intermedia]|uniref:hypothetical protein n=1 Tax=Yersinia intermedia TaxID=631 RepID=UPI0022FE46C4|nr:hypothetical protein [Yersinia intermedia]MDA5513516.1 hypothetical protein [Yersinia intermedia]
MATSNKRYKITYYSDDMELLNKMAFIAKQFDIKAEGYGEGGLMKSSDVVLNEDHEDFINKSAQQENNNDTLKSFKDFLSNKYKQ